MTRRTWAGGLLPAILVAASIATASPAGAARSAGVCKPFTSSGLKYQWSAIGKVSCTQAKPWLTKLLADHVASASMKVGLPHSPKGFQCHATLVTKGRPSGGVCYTGTFAYPKNGFQWYGS